MAEGGVEEMAKAYQTATEKMCELCLDEDSFKQAMWYCKQCRQRLCDKCRKYHMKVPVLKDHKVVRAEEMPPVTPQSTEELSDELRTPMCLIHNLPIELYCEEHNQPVCNSCKLVDHRKCKRLRNLENVATENTGKSNEVLQHLKYIDLGLGKTKEAMTKESHSMEEQKEQLIHKIKDKMQEIEALGHKKIAEVEKMFEKEQASLQKEKDGITHTQLLVSKSIGDIETATQTGSEEELFLATSHAEKEAGKYQDILNDTSHVIHREADFEIDSRLKDFDSFGKIDIMECKVGVDIEHRAAEYLNSKSLLSIFWFDILPGDQVIALHRDETRQQSDHLSLYSRGTGLLSQLDLPGVALSADTLNDHQVIVTIVDKQCLLMVDIVNNKLVQKDTIQTKGNPYLILKYSEQSVLVLVYMDDKFCVQILDLRGNVETTIPINVSLVSLGFMRMSNDRDIIFINDDKKGCYGFNLKGDTLFHYTQPDVIEYAGLAIDHHNCVYLSIEDQEGYHLAKLSPTGQHLQRIDCDYGWPVRYDRNKLYLVGQNAQNECVINYIYV